MWILAVMPVPVMMMALGPAYVMTSNKFDAIVASPGDVGASGEAPSADSGLLWGCRYK